MIIAIYASKTNLEQRFALKKTKIFCAKSKPQGDMAVSIFDW